MYIFCSNLQETHLLLFQYVYSNVSMFFYLVIKKIMKYTPNNYCKQNKVKLAITILLYFLEYQTKGTVLCHSITSCFTWV